jgi:hypothetical protein
MSGYANINAFSDPNILLKTLSGQQTADVQSQNIANQYAPARNQLLLDTGNEALNFAQQKDPLEIQQLRQQLGIDPNPVLDRLTKLYSGNNPPPAVPGSGSGTASTGGGIGAGGDIEAPALASAQAVRDGLIARGMAPEGATAFAANALHESVANPFTGPGDMGASHGLFQWNGDRLAAFQRANGGLLPEQTSLDKQLDFVVSELNGPESLARDRIMQAQGPDGKAAQVSEAYLRPKDTVPEMQRRSATALKLAGLWAGQGGQGGQPTGGAPGAAPPQLGTPGGGQPTAGMTDAQWLAQAGKSYPGLLGPNDTSQQPNAGAPTATAGAPAPSTQATRLGGTATAGPAAGPSPGMPQPPPNQIGPGGANGPTVPAPQAAAPPPTQPALPPSGMASPQVQQAQQLLRQATQVELAAAASPNDPRVKAAATAMAADLRQRAQILMQTDTVVQLPDGRQYHPLTGKMDDPAKPLPNWQYSPNAGGPGIPGQVDTTGTNKAEVNPARRMNVRADGSVINDLGQVIAPALSGVTPPLGSFEVQKDDYNRDQKALPEIAQAGQSAQTAQVRLQTLLDILPKISTGAGGITRAQLANLAETAGFPGIAQTLIAHTADGDAAAAQEFGKLTLASAGAAERGDLGSRGSLGAIKLYQQNNPGLDLRPGANKAMLGMQLIAAQADTDYSQAALAYANKHATDFRTGAGPYTPLANLDLQWQQQRNPQVYAAAMGALNGQPAATWSKGLSDPEYERALNVVSRASPSAVVDTRTGGKRSMQPNPTATGGAGAAPVTVQTPADAQALPAGTRYTTPDGRMFTR